MSKEINNLKFYVDWTVASTRANILPGTKSGSDHGEALATSMGKIAKWFTDIEATGLFDGTADTKYTFTNGSDGSFDVLPSTSGATAQTVRVLPAVTTSDEGKVLMVDSTGAPVYTEQAWITKAVADLDNYYLKYNSAGSGDFADKTKATYSASEIDGLLAPKIDVQVVTALPTTDISKTTIYLVPNSSTLTNNTYDEYVYINKGSAATPDWGWEKIGVQEIDLTGYLKAANVTNGDATSGLGTFYVQGNGGSKTAVTVYGLGTAAGKTAATTITTGTGGNADDDHVPTSKAVAELVASSGVTSISGGDGITVGSTDPATGAVTVAIDNTVTAQTTEALYTITHDAQGLVTASTAATGATIRGLSPYSGGNKITIASDGTINHDTSGVGTEITTAAFNKFKYDSYGHVTGVTAVAASDIRDLTPYSGTTDQITLGNDGAFGLADVPANTTDAATFVKLHVDAKGRVDRTAAVEKSDLTGLIGKIGDNGVTGTALVAVPTEGDVTAGKFFRADGTWVAIETTDTTYTLSGATYPTTGTDAGKVVITLTDNNSQTTTAKIDPFSTTTQGIVSASGNADYVLLGNNTWTDTLPDGTKATTQAITDDSTKVATTAFVHDILEDLIIHATA